MRNGLRRWLESRRWRGTVSYLWVAGLAFGLGASVVHSESRDAPSSGESHADDASASEETVWTCAMHPQVRQPEPGACPICGMDLIPLEQGERRDLAPARVTLSERAQALARVRTTPVRRQADPAADLRLLGRIEPDETTSRLVTAWVGGRIDRLHVRITGERVRAGQTIATLYSPEVLAAHQDLIAAKRQLDRMQGASELGRTAASAALQAARDRLRLLGVADKRLEEMEGESQPTRRIGIQSPFGGTVIERLATEGAYVSTGDPLYRIANLTSVWVQLDAYERDLPSLQVQQTVRVEVESLPGVSFEGRVAFIDPVVDPQRRTARVRVEVANPDGRLKPGMFAHAVVQGHVGAALDQPLVVPRTAPLFTGRRSIVYVEVPSVERPTYEARVVRLGPRTGDVYPVVAGLTEGERVVFEGAFVLDADLQIRGGSSMMTSPDDTEPGPWDEVIELPASESRKLAPVLEAYLALQRALAADDPKAARAAAEQVARRAAEVKLETPRAARDAWQTMSQDVRGLTQHIAQAESLEGARGPFEGLSGQMMSLLRRFGNPLERTLYTAFCPMASGQGASWIQAGDEIDNPYFGAAMRTCGDLLESVPRGGYLPAPTETPPPTTPHAGHHH